MKAVAEVIGVSRSNLIERLRDRPKKRLGRPPLPDDELVDIKAVIVDPCGTVAHYRGTSQSRSRTCLISRSK